ncbi:MAG: hypothetical protein JSW65_07710 [Candidatus Bipolaricaulota bacterium]|nr:MAG: hypothetical protein JSW65_07710 [Candidatus Bipolaricaulota bacterium]
MRRVARSVVTGVVVALCVAVSFDLKAVADGGVNPYEVVIWQHVNFTGQRQSFRLEDSMRHRLVTDLGWFDERISSIQVGSEVRVAVFRFPGFAGPADIFSANVHSLSDYWNDAISSLIVFPRKYGHTTLERPLGVYLHEETCWKVAGYTSGHGPVRAFYPLPQSEKTIEAGYSYVGSYMDGNVFYVTLQGLDVEAELFYERSFGGSTYTLTFPKDTKDEPNAVSECPPYGYKEVDLTYWSPWAHRGYWQGVIWIPARARTQSLKVRWSGTPPGDTRSPGFVGSSSGPHIEEPDGQPEFVPDISGTWQSTFQLAYVITQSGHDFTWYVERFREWGYGTIYGLQLEVAWEGENGSGHDIGTAILDEYDNVVRIEWASGNVFFRRGEAP